MGSVYSAYTFINSYVVETVLCTRSGDRLPNMGGRIGIDVDEMIRKFGVGYDIAQRGEGSAESLAWSDTDCYLDVVCLLHSCLVFAEAPAKY